LGQDVEIIELDSTRIGILQGGNRAH
jgi:hypothetical protein